MTTSVAYTAVLDVRRETVLFVSQLLHTERRRRGSRAGTRALGCFAQAVLVLRWFDGTRLAQLARDKTIAGSTAYRYLHEGIAALAERKPSLHGGSPRPPPTAIGWEQTIDKSDTVTLWRPTGQAELDLVAASGWRAWPARLPDQPIFYPVLNRWYATKIAREWNVPAGGVGYVTRFDVERSHLGRYEVHQVGGRDVLEYWIPAEELADFNAHIVGAIMEEADYRGPVNDQEFTDVGNALDRPLPAEWRSYLQGESWFRRGWMASGAYVWLNSPREMLELHDAWDEAVNGHPGIAIIGGDGSREHLVLDLRSDPAPVLMVDLTSSGWESAVRQADDVSQLIDRIEAGTFEFAFED